MAAPPTPTSCSRPGSRSGPSVCCPRCGCGPCRRSGCTRWRMCGRSPRCSRTWTSWSPAITTWSSTHCRGRAGRCCCASRADRRAGCPAAALAHLADRRAGQQHRRSGLLQRTGARFPAATPTLGRLTGLLALRQLQARRQPPRLRQQPAGVRFTKSEWALPRAARGRRSRRCYAPGRAGRLPVTFPIEVRLAAEDDALLSTAYGRATAYVAVHQYRGRGLAAYFRAVERVMLDLDGRPHWGKGTSRRRCARPPLPRVGPVPGGAGPAGPGRRLHQRPPGPRAGSAGRAARCTVTAEAAYTRLETAVTVHRAARPADPARGPGGRW